MNRKRAGSREMRQRLVYSLLSSLWSPSFIMYIKNLTSKTLHACTVSAPDNDVVNFGHLMSNCVAEGVDDGQKYPTVHLALSSVAVEVPLLQ